MGHVMFSIKGESCCRYLSCTPEGEAFKKMRSISWRCGKSLTPSASG
jgi:hypothetical protein